jgi:hypothetical protein
MKGRCIDRTPGRCRYVRCRRIRLLAGQKYRVRKGACCGTVTGTPKPRCAGRSCRRVSCKAGYAFRYKSGKCCGKCVRNRKHFDLINFNVNANVVAAVADISLVWVARKRQAIEIRARQLFAQAKRCVRRGACRHAVAQRATRISSSIQNVLNRLRASRKQCKRRACKRNHRNEAAKCQKIAARVSRAAQFAAESSGQLVSLVINGFNQLQNVCRGASCVHGFAVQVTRLQDRLKRELRSCRSRRCRSRLTKAIRTVARPVRQTLIPSLRVAATVCTTRKCRRNVRRDIKRATRLAGRRRRGTRRGRSATRRVTRRLVPAVIRKLERRVNRRVQHGVKRINRVVRRCRRNNCSQRKLRKQLRKLHFPSSVKKLFNRARKACTTRRCRAALRRDYKRTVSVIRRILPKRIVNLPKRVSGRVVRTTRRRTTRRRASRATRKPRSVTRRRRVVSSLCRGVSRRRRCVLKQIAACADDDSKCVRRLFRSVAKLNSQGCRATKAKVAPKVVDPLTIPNVLWQNEFTCSGLNNAWKRWLSRQRKIRAYFLAQAHACAGSDTTCLRAYYRKLVVIHQRIARHSKDFVRRMSRCDSCAAIKLRFARWLKRQISKRARIHLQLGLCSNTDAECMQNHARFPVLFFYCLFYCF